MTVPVASEILDPPAFSLVVPCYNEEEAIVETLDELKRVLIDVGPHEVIVVNDGSSDRSGDLLQQAADSGDYPMLTVVNHEFNRGYGAALKTGIRNASAALVAITDADGTYPNERLGELVDLAVAATLGHGRRGADDQGRGDVPADSQDPQVVPDPLGQLAQRPEDSGHEQRHARVPS